MASSEDDIVDTMDNVGDGLFDDSDDEVEFEAEKTRELSDRELDSGDDEGRDDRAPRAEEPDFESGRDARILDTMVYRHPLPKPSDRELHSLRLPTFMGIEPAAFEPKEFVIPTSDHHTDTRSSNFSANAVAASTVRWRKGSTGSLESNTNIYRWSDGSTTIAIGDQHYELQGKSLAPPKDSKTYLEVQDSHSYLASPSIASQLLVLVGHMTNQYTVRPNKDIEDDALEKLQKSLAAATRGGHKGDDKGGPELITNTEDPELQKKKAELAEKERNRLQRRRETAAEKATLPKHTSIGRGGLNVDDLEGRSGRRASGPGRSKAPKRPRRGPDYDSDDEPGVRRNREDEYDKEDDFLASSDEELDGPEGDDDEEEEEMLDEESDREQPKSKRQKTSKPEEVSDADADAEADLDDDEVPAAPVSAEPAGRGRKRLIIEDDDDE